ncbi:MAG: sigma-70 family RNA polymerase sigma factor [Lentisphaeraceae bacterium]|nr:sigma-70 family RNA polymerase sigma factor [Lentisphaeraceae bacterium]
MSDKIDLTEFKNIVLEYEHSVRTSIRVMGIREGYVDDLAQETFILAYKKFHTFDQSRSLRAWLLSLAKNLVLNERRKVKRRQALLHEKYSLLVSDNLEANLDGLDFGYDKNVLDTCLDKLPENHRKLVTLRYFKEKNSKEIAQVMNKEASNIRHMLRRILESLKLCVFRQSDELRGNSL